jgi:hypothetical protein
MPSGRWRKQAHVGAAVEEREWAAVTIALEQTMTLEVCNPSGRAESLTAAASRMERRA